MVNSNLLLPQDSNGVISIASSGSKIQAINRLIASNTAGALVLLARRVYANNELSARGRMVAPANITYNCAYYNSGNRTLTLAEGNQILSEIVNGNTAFGMLVNAVFEQGSRNYVRSQYRQRGLITFCN
jgi:hypothetical protein